MAHQEHRSSNNGRESKPELSKKPKPHKLPQRGPGIAFLEKLRNEDQLKKISDAGIGCELAGGSFLNPFSTSLHFRLPHPQPNVAGPSLPALDPCSSVGPYNLESFAFPLPYFQDSSPLGPSPTAQLPLVVPEKQPLLPVEHQQQLSQFLPVMSISSPYSMSRTGIQMESELPSNQSHYGIVNAAPPSEQHRIVGKKRPWPFQQDAPPRRVSIPRPKHFLHSDCEGMIMNGIVGERTECSRYEVPSSHNFRDNLISCHPPVDWNAAPEQHDAAPLDGGFVSLASTPFAYSSARPRQAMFVQWPSKLNLLQREKTDEESSGSDTITAPSKSPIFYNFMELPHIDEDTEFVLIANPHRTSGEGIDVSDTQLKL